MTTSWEVNALEWDVIHPARNEIVSKETTGL